jgi:hypothetical protein
MERPVSGTAMYWHTIETFRVASLALPQRDHLCSDLIAFKPSLQKLGCDVEENSFAKLLDGRQPLDIPGEIRTIDGKLNFIQLAFSGGRWRFQTRKAVNRSRRFLALAM